MAGNCGLAVDVLREACVAMKTPDTLRFSGVALGVLLVCMGISVEAGIAQERSDLAEREYQIKAAYLYHFAQFVTWPAPKNQQQTIQLCVVGDDPLGPLLDSLDEKTVEGKSLDIRRLSSIDDARSCHVLFVSSSESQRLPEIFKALQGASVFTVGETEDFTRQGGMARFYNMKNRVRFEINLEATERTGIKVSSKMLRLARRV